MRPLRRETEAMNLRRDHRASSYFRDLALFVGLGLLAGLIPVSAAEKTSADTTPAFRIKVDLGHPWRPPFGLDRVGRPTVAVVEAGAKPLSSHYELAANRRGKEVGRQSLRFSEGPGFVARASFEGAVDELILSAEKDPGGPRVELARQAVASRGLEAEAVARARDSGNPVDLGTILVPSGWLLLGPDPSATVDVAAIRYDGRAPEVQVRAWYESAPAKAATIGMPLEEGVRAHRALTLPELPAGQAHDRLIVAIEDGHGQSLWRKVIPVMRVANPPRWPAFGASASHLRFDAPISVRDPATGTFSSLPYDHGWDPKLEDVVVSFPNGARFVFWRGSSYIPFWAGRNNTGACYEWAEMLSRPKDAVDCVEPLMDKDLRFGRVEIVESTPARVLVRWRYQSTDLHYQVWGDSAVEDYCFYPDGFGTRVVTLTSDPKAEYELAEFILLTPQDAYPFAVLPEDPVDALFLDGQAQHYRTPHLASNGPVFRGREDVPAVYRLRLGKGERLAAISFNPNLRKVPSVVFGPFSDAGEVVTPCYWGSHWPLARGNATGSTIDERIHASPCHNSVMSWAGDRPSPLRTAEFVGPDALGRSRPLAERRWAWLIGMSDDPDDRLLERARSFATPPTLENLRGARFEAEAYVPERRALRLAVEASDVSVTIRPGTPCVNPVFELTGAPRGAVTVSLEGRPLDAKHFAWDGRTLWLDATIADPTELRLGFAAASKPSAP